MLLWLASMMSLLSDGSCSYLPFQLSKKGGQPSMRRLPLVNRNV